MGHSKALYAKEEWSGRSKRRAGRVGGGEDVGDSKHDETGGVGRRAFPTRRLCCKYLLVVCLLGETT